MTSLGTVVLEVEIGRNRIFAAVVVVVELILFLGQPPLLRNEH